MSFWIHSMGWIESPPYFCTASEMEWDFADQNIETPNGSWPEYKCLHHTTATNTYKSLLATINPLVGSLKYLTKVYVDDYIGLEIATPKKQLDHACSQQHNMQHSQDLPTGIGGWRWSFVVIKAVKPGGLVGCFEGNFGFYFWCLQENNVASWREARCHYRHSQILTMPFTKNAHFWHTRLKIFSPSFTKYGMCY